MTMHSIRCGLFTFVGVVIGFLIGLAIGISGVTDALKQTVPIRNYNYAAAAHDLVRGQTIKDGDITGIIIPYPCGYEDALVAQDSENLLGTKLLVPVNKDEPILKRFVVLEEPESKRDRISTFDK